MELLLWDIYEIASSESLQGVMLRGRLRKFAIQEHVNLLTENDGDGAIVRFAIIGDSDPESISAFVRSIIPDAVVTLVRKTVPNPVLSKLKVNEDARYTIS